MNKDEKLNRLIELAKLADTLTNAQAKQFVELLVSLTNKQKEELVKQFNDFADTVSQETHTKITEAIAFITQKASDNQTEVRQLTNKQQKAHDKRMAELQDLIDELRSIEIRDGIDADEEKIVEDVLARIPKPEVVVLDDREKIVNKINSGKEKDAKIEAKQITGLPDFTREVIREVGTTFQAETPLKAGANITITKDASGANVITSSSGGGTWGTITGTLSDQTDLQTALDAKQDTITGLTASGAELNILDGATLSTTELNYVDGVTSAIQTQIDGKQASDATLTALAAYNTNGILTQTAADTFTGRTITGTANQITVGDGNGVAGNPTLSLPADVIIPTVLTVPNTGLHLLDSDASHDLIIKPGSNLTADKTLTITTGDADVILNLTAVTDEYVLAYDSGTNTWRGVAVAAGGDVTKVGTPVNNQVGVWTGDGTLEGDVGLTFDTTDDTLSTAILNATSLTASEIVATNADKDLVSLAVATYPSLTELTYVKGVTSSIQTQLNAKGTGNVTKVGTPVNNQVGVWTGDGTIEGDTGLTFDGTSLLVSTGVNLGNSDNGIRKTTLFGQTGVWTAITAGTRWGVHDNGPSGAILELVTGSYPSYDNAYFKIHARLIGNQGADVASANNLATGLDGNVFEITGTTQINLISNVSWTNGATITLLFTSTPTVKHNQATSGTDITIQLAGAADFVAAAGDTLTLVLSEIGGTQAWRELTRSLVAGSSGANTALSNLASVAINTTLVSDTYNTDALGTSAIAWSDLYLGTGAVIEFSSAASTPDVTITHSANTLTIAGGTLALGAENLTMTGSIAATGARVTKGWFTDIESTNMPTVGGTAILTSLTAPQFTTIELGHATDTTLARVSAGVVSVEGVRVITSAGTTANTILKNNGTTFVASTETYAAPGTSGNVMTSDGTNWTSAAPSGGSPKMIRSTMFETSTRFTLTASGGTAAYGTQGLTLDTTGTTTRYASVAWGVMNSSGSIRSGLFLGSPTFSVSIYCSDPTPASGDGSLFAGLGPVTVAGSGHTYTTNHAGFKLLKTGGVVSLYATQANGTTETASSALTTVARFDVLDLIMRVNGTSSIDYYWRKNGGSLSSATNLSTNMPSDADASDCQFSVSNNSTAVQYAFIFGGAHYER